LAIDFGYPLGVEDATLLGRPYVSITKKYGKTVCHYPILNDLRVVLNLLEIQEYLIWSQTKYTGLLDKTKYFKTRPYDGSSIQVSGTSDEKPWSTHDYFGHLVLDDTFLYAIGESPNVIKMLLSDYSIVKTGDFSPFCAAIDITIDENYIWAVDNNNIICKIDKNSFAILETYDLNTVIPYTYISDVSGIACDKDYLYITGGQVLQHIHPRNIYRVVVAKLKKDFTTCVYTSFAFDYYGYSRAHIEADTGHSPAIDENYLYLRYSESGNDWDISGLHPINYYYYNALLKIDRDTLVGSLVKIGFLASGLVCAQDYLYDVESGLPRLVSVYDKTGVLQYSTTLDVLFNSTNCLPASIYEYKLSK
jgi:hypothetical protein